MGVDVGGVIIDGARNDGTDTSLHSVRYLETTAVPGAFDALRRLTAERFGEGLFVISKCGPDVQRRTLEWMTHHHFFARTGIAPSRIHFCRAQCEKGSLCADLGITHYVDDRIEVLMYLTTVPHRYLFRPDEREVQRFARALPEVRRRMEGWDEVLAELLS